MNNSRVQELLCQALETEIGGSFVYEHALRCAQNEDLENEWIEYREQTRNHERILRDVFRRLGLSEMETPGRKVARHQGRSLVQQIVMARHAAPPASAQLIAVECVVLTETQAFQTWELLGAVGQATEAWQPLTEAHALVEDEEDEHLLHAKNWARELWREFLGLPAALPPPEEPKRTAQDRADAPSDPEWIARSRRPDRRRLVSRSIWKRGG
jgi:hypothetical protein